MRLVCFAQSKLLTTIADISEPGSVLVLMREAQRNVTAFGDPQSAADFHTRVAQIEARQGNHIQAKHHLGAAKLMLRADPNVWLEGSLNLSASAIHFLSSELDAAHKFAENALSCARDSGHARTRMAATANIGLLDLHLGNLVSAERHLAQALPLCKEFSVSQISLLDSYAQLQLTRGRHAECQELLRQIDEKIAVYEPSVLSWQQLAVGATRLRSLLACNEWSNAAHCGAKLIKSADGRSDKTHQISLRVLAADALIELGRRDEATTYINAAAELAEDVPVAVFAEIERVRATLLAHSGAVESARRQFERSLRMLSAVGGVAPRMDAALSYLRTMQPDKEVRRALKADPWNLGKEVIARLIHKYSDRSERDFVAHNCTGVPRDMVESQLFGHRRGAFTGAQADSPGVIRAASGGTLLLDEIGELDLDTQPKLLRFLENSEIQPIGESRPVKVDVRVIAATNANLDDKIRDGSFREDLLYRVNIFTLHIPPLRSRREEILPLAQHFLRKYARESGRTNIRITEDAQKCLLLFEWPGNVRQLDHEIKRAVAMTDGDSVLGLKQLSLPVIEAGKAIADTVQSARTPGGQEVSIQIDRPLADAVEELEETMIRRALKACKGRFGMAAQRLGLSRKGLYLKRQRLGITDDD